MNEERTFGGLLVSSCGQLSNSGNLAKRRCSTKAVPSNSLTFHLVNLPHLGQANQVHTDALNIQKNRFVNDEQEGLTQTPNKLTYVSQHWWTTHKDKVKLIRKNNIS